MESAEVLSILFDFVGKGHFLYVAGVSRSWRRHYISKVADENGILKTTWHDAVATIATLEYGFANHLKSFFRFYPAKDDFGPGVYKWARQHDLPLFVWIAYKIIYRTHGGQHSSVLGVFSSPSKAKAGACSRGGQVNVAPEWKSISPGCFLLTCFDDPETHCLWVQAFAVKGLPYADEIHPLRLYVTSRTYRAALIIEGVFPTKELANASIEELATQQDGILCSKRDLVSCHVGDDDVHATTWEGYLDGEGGAAGEFFTEHEF